MLKFTLMNTLYTHGLVPIRELTQEEKDKHGVKDTNAYVVLEGDRDVSILKVGDEVFEGNINVRGIQELSPLGKITSIDEIADK